MDLILSFVALFALLWLVLILIVPKAALCFLPMSMRKRWPWCLVAVTVIVGCACLVTPLQKTEAIEEDVIVDKEVVVILPTDSEPLGTWKFQFLPEDQHKPYYVTIYKKSGLYFEKMDRFIDTLRVEGEKLIKVDDRFHEYYVIRGDTLQCYSENGEIDPEHREISISVVGNPRYVIE